MVIYIGIDNGVSGSIGVVTESGKAVDAFDTPAYMELSYTKSRQNISRIDHKVLYRKFKTYRESFPTDTDFRVFLERPMTAGLGRIKAMFSGMRALEATLIVVERMKWHYEYVDSKEWQSVVLPKGSTKDQLKKDSMTIGCRLFPDYKKGITKHKDADGLLIAEAMRRLKR